MVDPVIQLFRDLLDSSIAIAEGPIAEVTASAAHQGLLPGENGALNAVPKRRAEYLAGRALARSAMTSLGYPPSAIPTGADRAPIWPHGLTGSITHSAQRCAAAVAPLDAGIRAIGIDLEPSEPLPIDLWESVLRPLEFEWLSRQPALARGELARAIYSAKESAYKCQYTLSRSSLEFHDLEIVLDADRGSFAAVFHRPAGTFKVGDFVRGRVGFDSGWVATAVTI
ncbi:MAG: 4'-phosphopantetheinyl transferase [Hyphomicrobium sp.]